MDAGKWRVVGVLTHTHTATRTARAASDGSVRSAASIRVKGLGFWGLGL
jgi:hypothetical protein